VGFETSLFVASYDSQGYGGGIRPLLHTGERREEKRREEKRREEKRREEKRREEKRREEKRRIRSTRPLL
jgi:hypothetical protein